MFICLFVTIYARTNPYTLYRNIPEEILKNVAFEEGVKVLDLGCGPGTWIMVIHILTTYTGGMGDIKVILFVGRSN